MQVQGGYCHLLQEVPGGEDPGLGPGLGPPAHPQLVRVRVRSLPAVITLPRVDAPNTHGAVHKTCDRQKILGGLKWLKMALNAYLTQLFSIDFILGYPCVFREQPPMKDHVLGIVKVSN